MIFLFSAFLLVTNAFSKISFPKDFYLNEGCSLYKTNGDLVKKFPGYMCLFHPNGNLISASITSLTMFSPKLEKLWEIPGFFHHHMNFSEDKKKILALASSNEKQKDGIHRQDVFMVIDLDGKIVAKANASELLKKHIKFTGAKLGGMWKQLTAADIEDTHFNSIYEIPENTSPLKYLKAGNIVVNSVVSGHCFLSPDLKKSEFCKVLPISPDPTIHDLQVTPKGELLLFNNQVRDVGEDPYSAIVKRDPVAAKTIYEFTAEPKEMFFSPVKGSVQQLMPDILLVSHMYDGVFFIRESTKKVEMYLPYSVFDGMMPPPIHQVKGLFLGNYLSFWK